MKPTNKRKSRTKCNECLKSKEKQMNKTKIIIFNALEIVEGRKSGFFFLLSLCNKYSDPFIDLRLSILIDFSFFFILRPSLWFSVDGVVRIYYITADLKSLIFGFFFFQKLKSQSAECKDLFRVRRWLRNEILVFAVVAFNDSGSS